MNIMGGWIIIIRAKCAFKIIRDLYSETKLQGL